MANYTPRTPRTITVNIQKDGGEDLTGFTATWTIVAAAPFSASDFAEIGANDGTVTGPVYDGRDYRVTFDPVAGYVTPVAVTVTAGATPQEVVGNYVEIVAGANEINIFMQDESAAALNTGLQRVPWTLYKNGVYDDDGDETTPMPLTGKTDGDYFVQWGWHRDYWPPHAYEDADTTLAPPRTPGTYNGEVVTAETDAGYVDGDGTPQQISIAPYKVPRSGPTQTMSGSNPLTFTGRYQSRGIPANIPVGTSMNPDWYWQQADITADCMVGRLTNSGPNITNHDAHGWPTSFLQQITFDIRVNAPPGATGIQNYWLFWEGQGSIAVNTDGNSDGGSFALPLSGGNNGDVGQPGGGGIQIQLDVGPEDASGGHGYMNITGSVGGANYLRNLELVHESYCGTPASAAQTTDAWRVNPLTAEGKWFLDYNRIVRFLTHNDKVERWLASEVSPDPVDGNSSQNIDFAGNGRQMDDFVTQWGYDGSAWYQTEVVHSIRDCLQQKIDIANASDSDLWICLHPFKDESMWNEMIDMIEAPYSTDAKKGWEPNGLNPARRVYWEYNEVWFDIFPYGEYFRFWGNWYANQPTDHLGRAWNTVGPTPIAAPTSVQLGFENSAQYDDVLTYKTHCYHLWLLGQEIRNNNAYTTNYTNQGWLKLQDRHRIILGVQTAQGQTYTHNAFLNIQPDGFPLFVTSGNPINPSDVTSFDGSTLCLENFYATSGTNYLASKSLYSTLTTDVSNSANWEEGANEWRTINETRILSGGTDEAEKNDWQGNRQVLIDLPARSDGGKLTCVGYEGGNGDTPGSVSGGEAAWVDHLRHMHQHYALHKFMYFHFRDAGYDEACHYSAPTAWPPLTQGGLVGSFGIKDSMNMADSVAYKWQGHVDGAHEHPADW